MQHWTIDYLKAVLSETGWSANKLSKEAGLAASTLNRPLRDPDWSYALSHRTLACIHRASGIDPGSFARSAGDDGWYTLDSNTTTPNNIRIEIEDGQAVISARVDAQGLQSLRRKLDAVSALLDE